MPVVRVSFIEGRSDGQKQQLAEAITDSLARITRSKREAVNVIFGDVPERDWYPGGALTSRARTS
jgi:4-oxalocrotonate tautomerase